MNELITNYIKNIDKTNVKFIYLLGSYASKKETIYSDVDLKVVLKEGPSKFDTGYIGNTYVTCKYESTEDMEQFFKDPIQYLYMKNTIKELVVLYDEDNHYDDFKSLFNKIEYHKHFHKEIKDYVNKELIDWFEEVNKSLNGLYLKDDAKLLAGLHGLTYGMLNILAVSEGIEADSLGMLSRYKKYFKSNQSYKYLLRAFGVVKHSLKTRTLYGFRLYLEICLIIKKHLTIETEQQLNIVKKNIIKALHNY